MRTHPPEPSGDECNSNARLADFEGRKAFAAWYPQMGGYGGKCVVLVSGGGCFDAWIWHDGEFPFGDDHRPVRIHHCDPYQFIEFGNFVTECQKPKTEEQRT